MKFVRWMRFTWDLVKLPDACELDPHYRIRAATRDDEPAVRALFQRAFTLDTDWAEARTQVVTMIEAHLDEIFRQREIPCLVVTHGARIIGASALTLAQEAESHLLSGPCLLIEYRRRGIGSALLHQSLARLREAGLMQALGVTREAVPSARFVYPKFESVSVEYDFASLPVG